MKPVRGKFSVIRYFSVGALMGAFSLSSALSEELPSKLLGIWSEPASDINTCGEEILEIAKVGGGIDVSGRSGDWVFSWTEGRRIAGERITSRITGSTSEFVAYSVKTRCEEIDQGKEKPGIAIVVYVPPSIPGTSIEQLYIHSAADAYSGNYRKCKRVNSRTSDR
jgi:hypothetical protein